MLISVRKNQHTVAAGSAIAVALASPTAVVGTERSDQSITAYVEAGSMEPLDLQQASDLRSSFTVTLPVTKDVWDKKDAKRFKALAVKRAVGESSNEEDSEFLWLQEARRRLDTTSTAEQILADIKRAQMLEDLHDFFEKHSVFHSRSNQKRSRPQRQTHRAQLPKKGADTPARGF